MKKTALRQLRDSIGVGEIFHVLQRCKHVCANNWRLRVVQALWDDAAFKNRVKMFAKQRGLSVRAALAAAGITTRYVSRSQEGRSTNLILNLALALDVTPGELMGLNEPSERGAAPAVDSEKLQRITVAARMMAAQIAALAYVASEGGDVDLETLMKLVITRINGLNQPQRDDEKIAK